MRQVVVTPETKFREVTDQLRASVSGMKAIVLIGPDGEILDHLALDPSFDVESFTSEYAMLLRIAQRSFEDTGAGDLTAGRGKAPGAVFGLSLAAAGTTADTAGRAAEAEGEAGTGVSAVWTGADGAGSGAAPGLVGLVGVGVSGGSAFAAGAFEAAPSVPAGRPVEM